MASCNFWFSVFENQKMKAKAEKKFGRIVLIFLDFHQIFEKSRSYKVAFTSSEKRKWFSFTPATTAITTTSTAIVAYLPPSPPSPTSLPPTSPQKCQSQRKFSVFRKKNSIDYQTVSVFSFQKEQIETEFQFLEG